MFSLKEEDIAKKKILDCPAGACSFTATGSEKGIDITASDIAYHFPVEQLNEKGSEDILHIDETMSKVTEAYNWDFHENIAELVKHRKRALYTCTNHMSKFPRQYVAATLPSLPFTEEEFDITLSAHFLFTYSNQLDFKFHLDTIKELLRVTKEEVRIFPLVDLEGKKSRYLNVLREELKNDAIWIEEKVAYEFQKNAHTMLRLKKV
ncbi:hypothetical protein J2S19_000669 [Metabacillus malikii]|uniref:SAM-dependent methyltransferase n=2 Tax=Metabacillus malikii TaxID=1504265 RepID=A0ABT9ZAZ0_9BACI|nr:hypothetical protein [Metabacillus malikii]